MNQAPAPSRLAYGLLGALTVLAFGGPFLLMAIIGGGENPKWPPDRPVEWVAFVTIVALVLILMTLCVTVRLWLPWANARGAGASVPPGRDTPGR